MARFVVTTLADSGAGSLRDAIARAGAAPGRHDIAFDERIVFDEGPFRPTVQLLSPLVVAAGDIRIDGDLNDDGLIDVTVSGGRIQGGPSTTASGVRHFEVGPAAALTLTGLALVGGEAVAGPDATGPAVSSILNEGRLTLRHVSIGGNARSLDRAPGEGAAPDAATVFNAAGATMTAIGVLIGGFSIAGGDAATAAEAGPKGASAVLGILNEGTLRANLVAVGGGGATGGAVSGDGRDGGDGVAGVLNRGVLLGAPLGTGFDLVLGAGRGDVLASGGAATDGAAGEGHVGALDAGAGTGAAAARLGAHEFAGSFAGAEPGLVLHIAPRSASGFLTDIRGAEGADTILGGDAAEALSGVGGDDLLFGGGGNDFLFGGPGSDTLHGGAGNDSFDALGLFRAASASDEVSVFGGAGNDRIVLGTAGAARIDGGAGRDVIEFFGSTDTGFSLDLRLSGLQEIAADLRVEVTGVELLIGGEMSDSVTLGAVAMRVEGRSGDDTLTGGDGADHLSGELGLDRLAGEAGDDTLLGGGSPDLLEGGAGRDLLEGASGGDRLDGGDGADVLRGGGGVDTMIGGAGADTLQAGGGRPGTDVLFGGAGADLLTGGRGPDIFAFDRRSGRDTVTDFDPEADFLGFIDGTRTFAGLRIVAVAEGLLVRHAGGSVLLEGLAPGALTEADVLF